MALKLEKLVVVASASSLIVAGLSGAYGLIEGVSSMRTLAIYLFGIALFIACLPLVIFAGAIIVEKFR